MTDDISSLDYDRVERALQEAHDDHAELQRATKRVEAQIASLTELKRDLEIYKIRRMVGES